MENLKSYTDSLVKFFEECELKSVTWDTEDDNLWLATFESKSGQTRQYKTNRQTMLAFCKKFYHDLAKLEDKAILVHTWKRHALQLYAQEYNLNRLLNQLKPNGNDEFCDCNCNTASSCIACRYRTKLQESK